MDPCSEVRKLTETGRKNDTKFDISICLTGRTLEAGAGLNGFNGSIFMAENYLTFWQPAEKSSRVHS